MVTHVPQHPSHQSVAAHRRRQRLRELAHLSATLEGIGAELVDDRLGRVDPAAELGVLVAELGVLVAEAVGVVGEHCAKIGADEERPVVTRTAARDGIAAPNTTRVAACLVVPYGSHRPQALARALLAHHPDWAIGASWCGDPHLRPRADGVPWWDEAAPADEWLLAAAEPHLAEWIHALDTSLALFDRGVDIVVLAWVGAVAVLRPITGLIDPPPTVRAPLTVVPRRLDGVPPADGLTPDLGELLDHGPLHTHVVVLSALGRDAIAELRGRLTDGARSGSDVRVGHELLDVALGRGARWCDDETIGAGSWRWPQVDPAMLVVPEYDVDRPWTLGSHDRHPMRVELVGHAARRRAIDAATEQLAGARQPLRLPGGLTIDSTVQHVARTHPDARPWSAPAAFRRQLDHEYWPALHDARADLRRAFARTAGEDAAAFTAWCRLAFVDDRAPLLVRPPIDARSRSHAPHVRVVDPPESGGVNVAGYLSRALGLGEIGRRLVEACTSAGVPTSTLDFTRTDSPIASGAPAADATVRYDTTIAVVNADQLDGLLDDVPAIAGQDRRLIGYWFWEVEFVPEVMRRAMRRVDEVWVATSFVATALSAVGGPRVRLMPLPIPPPVASDRTRVDFPPLADAADALVFLVTLDHLSVTERKNPLAAIEAHRRAFGPDDGRLLLVKTMNARHRREQHERLLRAAAGRPDIRVWDAAIPRSDLMALVRASDCVVSLHRSEGLGLHLAEAMWLGVPTIATRYSGNLDLADDDSAALVDADLVPVRGGEGVYPGIARWAEPRLEQAVAAMRRMADDDLWRRGIAAAGRARMESQLSLREAGRNIAVALGCRA